MHVPNINTSYVKTYIREVDIESQNYLSFNNDMKDFILCLGHLHITSGTLPPL